MKSVFASILAISAVFAFAQNARAARSQRVACFVKSYGFADPNEVKSIPLFESFMSAESPECEFQSTATIETIRGPKTLSFKGRLRLSATNGFHQALEVRLAVKSDGVWRVFDNLESFSGRVSGGFFLQSVKDNYVILTRSSDKLNIVCI